MKLRQHNDDLSMNQPTSDFLQKLGFELEFSRGGYANNSTFHFLKKSLV
jgi:hypothetical protein